MNFHKEEEKKKTFDGICEKCSRPANVLSGLWFCATRQKLTHTHAYAHTHTINTVEDLLVRWEFSMRCVCKIRRPPGSDCNSVSRHSPSCAIASQLLRIAIFSRRFCFPPNAHIISNWMLLMEFFFLWMDLFGKYGAGSVPVSLKMENIASKYLHTLRQANVASVSLFVSSACGFLPVLIASDEAWRTGRSKISSEIPKLSRHNRCTTENPSDSSQMKAAINVN